MWILIDTQGFVIGYNEKDKIRGMGEYSRSASPAWYNTKTKRTQKLFDNNGKPNQPKVNDKAVSIKDIDGDSLGIWNTLYNNWFDRTIVTDLKNNNKIIKSIFENVGVNYTLDIDKLDEIGLRGLAKELGIDVRDFSTKPTYQEIQKGARPQIKRDEFSAGIINSVQQYVSYEDYKNIDDAVKEMETTPITTLPVQPSTVAGPKKIDTVSQDEPQVNVGYPKTFYNSDGQPTTVLTKEAEEAAKRSGFNLLESPMMTEEELKIIVYRDGEQKEILQSDLALFEADGWSTTEQEVVVTPTVETVGISNDWNTDGSNIVNLNGKRYALFAKGNSFRSAGSETEFNALLNGINEDTGEADPDLAGYKPIGNQNPVWLNFAQSENLDDIEIIVTDDLSYDDIAVDAPTGSGQEQNTETIEFNNIPNEGKLWDVEGSLYIVYEVPGANGEVYEGSPVYMAYEVAGNDIYEAGLLTKGETAPQPNAIVDKTFFNNTSVVAGNTQQLSALIDNPFASFVETITEQSQVAPWITDPEMIALIAEAAIENREITDAEWQTTNWYQTHNESEREWLRTYYSDPSTATQLTTDSQIAVANSLQAAGVSNAPEALINWVAGKFVSGEWSETYTGEQISLFADPYATGKRDESFENYLSSIALTGVDRTTEREREVRELYGKWLGPTLGNLNDNEVAEIAGRLRDDPEYQDQLVQSLKQSRLAAFGAYTNPELTYEDIARPWRNLTTSVWGQTADETQGWWQEMVKSNDFAQAQNTLREKGLEQDITQVTTDATQALQQALGQGTISQSGVNV